MKGLFSPLQVAPSSLKPHRRLQIGSLETELLAVLGPLTVVGSSSRGGKSLIVLRAVGPLGALLPPSRISPGDQVALGSSVQMALAEELDLEVQPHPRLASHLRALG